MSGVGVHNFVVRFLQLGCRIFTTLLSDFQQLGGHLQASVTLEYKTSRETKKSRIELRVATIRIGEPAELHKGILYGSAEQWLSDTYKIIVK